MKNYNQDLKYTSDIYEIPEFWMIYDFNAYQISLNYFFIL